MCRTHCVTNNRIRRSYLRFFFFFFFSIEDRLSFLAKKPFKSLTASIIGMVTKRQKHANLSWSTFDLSPTSQKASLIHYSIFALIQEKASSHRPFYTESFYVSFFFDCECIYTWEQIFSKPILHWLFEFTDNLFHTWSCFSILLQASPNESSKHAICHHGNLLVTPVRIR